VIALRGSSDAVPMDMKRIDLLRDPSLGSSLEERSARAIAERELRVDVQRLRRGSVISIAVWVAFALCDYMQAEFVHDGDLRQLYTIRSVAAALLIAISVFVHRKRKLTRTEVEFGLYGSGLTMTTAIALMCLSGRGFESMNAAGVLLVIFAMILVPQPFVRGLSRLALVVAPYPIVLFGSAFFLDSMRTQLQSLHSVAFAIEFHFVGNVTMLFVAGVGHVLWSMRRELYQSQTVGRYRLTHRLGKGGMGEVWAAYHHGLERSVAVKILRPENERDEVDARRFEREIHALAGLEHPNTVKLYDFGIAEDGRLYYAMELLEGETLRKLVKREGRLSVARAISLVKQASRALAEAHARGIVHRDVKPDNLFVTSTDETKDVVKLIDFGIASVMGDSRFDVTRTGMVTGTPGTMAPEVIMGEVATPASDVYSLGAVFYLLLAGELPFGEDRGGATLVAHVHESPDLPSLRGDRVVPSEIERIIMRCLAKSPEDRFANAGELANALDACAFSGSFHLVPEPARADAPSIAEAPEPTRNMGRRPGRESH